MLAKVRNELESGVALFAANANASKVSVVTDLIKVVLDILEKHVGIDADDMASYVGKLYDQYIEPIDLPGVPDLAEGAVDKVLKATLESIIKKTIQRMQAQ